MTRTLLISWIFVFRDAQAKISMVQSILVSVTFFSGKRTKPSLGIELLVVIFYGFWAKNDLVHVKMCITIQNSEQKSFYNLHVRCRPPPVGSRNSTFFEKYFDRFLTTDGVLLQ